VKKIFIDTNIWLRFFLQDHPSQSLACNSLFHLIEQGTLTPYTSSIVTLELNFILKKIYKTSFQKTCLILNKLLSTRGITLIEKTNFKKALQLHLKTKVKLADCLIATQLPLNSAICTYDKDFKKLKVKTTTPDKITKSLLN